MSAVSAPEWLDYRGQPALRWRNLEGDSATVLLHGGQLVSWRSADGIEHLYMSGQALLDGQSAVRGGVPVCFPQFNMRGPLLKHGFARHLPWQFEGLTDDCLCLRLCSGPVTSRFWPHAFRLQLQVQLLPGTIRMSLEVENTDSRPWHFTAALHTYLRVDDVTRVRLHGLEGAQCWDAVENRHDRQQGAPGFGAAFDCVYQAGGGPLLLTGSVAQHGLQPALLRIAQSASCAQTVVWNPGPHQAKALADLPDADWQHMLCVEAASIDLPTELAPGQHWQCWQELCWQPGAAPQQPDRTGAAC